MRDHSRKIRAVLWLVIAIACAGSIFVVWLNRERGLSSSPKDPFPLPSYADSRFLNTGPEAHYIGTAACAACHAANHRSYLLTAHSRSLVDVDANNEPADGGFDHSLSGRSYRVYRRNSQLRHEELLRTAQGQEVTRVDVPIRYRIGSGHFTRSYLVELDGFLHESPITWYTSRKQWDMSPGYDFPKHWGFDRPVALECVACHAGRVEAVEGTLHRITFHEKAIGCENCHGPGSLHEELRRRPGSPAVHDDVTIVNPAKLSRPLLEDVCAACHQGGPATVVLRGRRPGDFRPGMPLTDHRTEYRFEGENELMTVTGHVTQLHQSACFQRSKEMTCLTCHAPHSPSKPKDLTTFYRDKCLSCHTEKACGVEVTLRRAKDAADNCLTCHMPRGDTEMPHITFTNHRIVRWPLQRPADLAPGGALLPDASSDRVPKLEPVEEGPGLSFLDQRRNLGMAYFSACRNPVYVRYGYAGVFQERARNLLEEVDAAGLPDPETWAALAELYREKDLVRASAHAEHALQAADLSPEARISALLILADEAMQERRFESARIWLEDVVRRRRAANDWYFLGVSYLQLQQPARAVPALRQAVVIRPDRSAVHARLARAYQRLGNLRLADEHEQKARWLFQESKE
jgi:predicted CXXCH cytochrome family protein